MIECRFPCDDNVSLNYFPDVEKIRYINSRIVGDESKRVFEHRLCSSLTNDAYYIKELIKERGEISEIKAWIDKSTYIYGAGARGKKLVELFPSVKWKGFIDEKCLGLCLGYPVEKLSKIDDNGNFKYLISIKEGYEEVKKQLLDKGVDEKNILVLEHYIKRIKENIYFDKKCLDGTRLCDGLFLDIGCYDGKDSKKAIAFFENTPLYVMAFEPNRRNYSICKKELDDKGNVKLMKYGISDKKGKSKFCENGGASKISDCGNEEIIITTIDEIIGNTKVGYIKMDIEGLEERALEGGRKTIRRDKPILAISIYHKRDDIWNIPLKILEIDPDYHFYLNHYSFSWDDTVLYAI